MRPLPASTYTRWAAWAAVLICAALGVSQAAMAASPQRSPVDDSTQVLVLLRLPPEHFRPNEDYSGSYGGGQASGARQRVANRLAHEHHLIVLSDWPMPVIGVDCFVMIVPADHTSNEIADVLSKDRRVAWAEPMNIYKGRGAPQPEGDSLFLAQPAARQWRLADLHHMATGENIRVAVIDSRIDQNHPDLSGQVRISENFVAGRDNQPEQHGTGVAGVIAARANNGPGIVGVAPRAQLMALRACWEESEPGVLSRATVCDSLSLAKALVFAIDHQAEVINLSLSGPYDPLLGKLIDVGLRRGITVVGAFDPDLPNGGFPASHAGVVAVSDGWPDAPRSGVFVAPGRDIPTTQPNGKWFLVNGSSYAAAHVSGLFALLRQRRPSARGASALVTLPPGSGIDACGTLIRAFGPCECGCDHASASSAISRH